MSDYTRICVSLTKDLRKRLTSHVPERLRSAFITQAMSMALDGMETYGSGFFGLMLNQDIKFSPASRLGQNLAKSKNGDKHEVRSLNSEDKPNGV